MPNSKPGQPKVSLGLSAREYEHLAHSLERQEQLSQNLDGQEVGRTIQYVMARNECALLLAKHGLIGGSAGSGRLLLGHTRPAQQLLSRSQTSSLRARG